MAGMLIMIAVVLGGLIFLAGTEERTDPGCITYDCDPDRLARESLRKPKETHHRYASALVYRKP